MGNRGNVESKAAEETTRVLDEGVVICPCNDIMCLDQPVRGSGQLQRVD